MIGLLLWSLAGSIVLILSIAILLNDLSQFKERTIDEVPDFLRPQDESLDKLLFDPAVDESLRLLRIPVNFRRRQRARLDLAARHYRCKHDHVRVVLQWGNTEWHDMHLLHSMDEYSEQALEDLVVLRRTGRRFCRLVLLLRLKLWVLRILMRVDKPRLLPTPSVGAQRRFLRVDMVQLYREFKAAVVSFARTYGQEQSERLASLL